jgi:hypothetical protein
MTSGRILGEHFNRFGKPKRGFPNEQAARRFKQKSNQTKHLHHYRCSFCGQWHLANDGR